MLQGSHLRRVRPTAAVALSLLIPAAVSAQSAISVRAGLISYFEGPVELSDPTKSQKAAGGLIHIEEGQLLTTKRGRAELLLLPGVFLRAGEQSEVEMVSSQISDVRVRLFSGSIVINLINKSSKDSVSILCRQAVVRFAKHGLYRIDDRPGEPPFVKVFRGKALITAFGSEHVVKSKQFMLLTKPVAGESISAFDRSDLDSLDRWSRKRAKAIAYGQRARRLAKESREPKQTFHVPPPSTPQSPLGYKCPCPSTSAGRLQGQK